MIIPDGQTGECGLSFDCDSNMFLLIIKFLHKQGVFVIRRRKFGWCCANALQE